MSVVARLEVEALDPARELAALLGRAEGDGAVVSFVGLARPRSKGGDVVDLLVLEHHPTLTAQSLEEIAVSAAERFDVSHVRVVLDAERCERASRSCLPAPRRRTDVRHLKPRIISWIG